MARGATQIIEGLNHEWGRRVEDRGQRAEASKANSARRQIIFGLHVEHTYSISPPATPLALMERPEGIEHRADVGGPINASETSVWRGYSGAVASKITFVEPA